MWLRMSRILPRWLAGFCERHELVSLCVVGLFAVLLCCPGDRMASVLSFGPRQRCSLPPDIRQCLRHLPCASSGGIWKKSHSERGCEAAVPLPGSAPRARECVGGHVGHPLASGQGCVMPGLGSCPGHPHSLEGLHTCSLGVAGLQPGPVLLLAQALAQAGLSPRLPPVSETLPGPQAGASLSGWDFLCVCAVAAGVGVGQNPLGSSSGGRMGAFQPCSSMSGAVGRKEGISQDPG